VKKQSERKAVSFIVRSIFSPSFSLSLSSIFKGKYLLGVKRYDTGWYGARRRNPHLHIWKHNVTEVRFKIKTMVRNAYQTGKDGWRGERVEGGREGGTENNFGVLLTRVVWS
jgi:hypothetical protein